MMRPTASMSQVSDIEPLNLPDRPELTHRAHRFPGKFHPPLIAKILHDNPGHEAIADPMCGSGTVGVEAIANNRHALCVDLDPLACLMTRGKTNPVSPNELEQVMLRIIDLAGSFPSPGEVDEESAKKEVENNLARTPSVPPLNLFHWFDPYVAVGFSRLVRSSYEVLEIESEEMNDAIRTALASSVRHISRADPQPVSGLEVTSVRKEQLKNGVTFDVESKFRSAVKRLAQGYEQLGDNDFLGSTTVVRANAKEFSRVVDESYLDPTLIITSPPYCNAIEYTRRHRLEYEWLGLFEGGTLERVRQERLRSSREFIGTPTIKQGTLRNLPTVPHEGIRNVTGVIEEEEGQERKANRLRKYFLDAYDWIEEIYETLPSDGLFYLIIGPSTSYGHHVNTPEFLSDIATDLGFSLDEQHIYKLTNNKMQYPTNGDTTEYESLIKFRK